MQAPGDPRVEKIETFSPYCHGNYLRIECEDQLDREMQHWIREADDCGIQKHFERRGSAVRRVKGAVRR